MIRTTLVLSLILMGATSARSAEPLTIGSPAPKLNVEAFLRGESVKGLSKGTIYVVEFSGTECAPCLKCIPHLTELQKKHKDIVIISVYSDEGQEPVSKFLAKHGDKIGYRVAIDPNGAMRQAWFDAAFREGIPEAFIVDANGMIAWIGNPAEMADPLAQIVSGKFDARFDILRLKLQQGAAQKLLLAAEREGKARETYDRINTQISKGKLTDALTATEAALKEYADTTEGLHLLRGTKLSLLTRLPDKKDAAVEFAIEVAIAAKLSRNELRCRQLAGILLRAANTPTSADRDLRLIDLAIALLQDTDESLDLYTRGRPKQHVQEYRIEIRQQLAFAYHLRGAYRAAVRKAEEAISLLKALQPDPSEDIEAFKKRRDAQLAHLTDNLSQYKRMVESPPKEK